MGDLQEIRYKHLILQLIKNKDQGRNVQGEWVGTEFFSAYPLVIVIFT